MLWLVVWRAASWAAAVAFTALLGQFGSAGWFFSAGGSPRACDSFDNVSVVLVCQGLGPLDAGNPDALVLRLPASPAEDEGRDSLVQALVRGVELPEGLNSESGQVFL